MTFSHGFVHPSPVTLAARLLRTLFCTALVCALYATATRAQTPAIRTDLNVYAEPAAPPLPRAGGKFTDPVFGTEVLRVTDEAGGANVGTAYSYWPTFNRDNTKLLAHQDGLWSGTVYDFDPVNFTLGASFVIPLLPDGTAFRGEDAVWSASSPNILYGHTDGGTKLWRFNVATRTYTLIGDLTSRMPGESLFQMSKADDDDTFAFTRRGPAPGYGYLGYIVYRVSTNSILSTTLGPTDECQVDKSGRYLIWKLDAQGAGVVNVRILDLQTNTWANLTDDAPDHSPGHSDVGTGTVVGAGNYLVGLSVRNLATPHTFRTALDLTAEAEYGAYHVSMLATNETWALVSFYGPIANGVFQHELVQVATDGSGRVRRLLHHHSVALQYYDTPRANISRDGRFIAFTSNWGVANGRRDLFVARITPAPDAAATPTPTPTPTATPTPAPTPATQNVVWTNLVNSVALSNTLQKTTGCNGCADASGVSVQTLANGDGYFEFTAVGTNKLRLAGLNSVVSGTTNIAYAIQLTDSGYAEVRENGAYKSNTLYQNGDVFRIMVVNGVVRYARNGTVFYSSAAAPVYPLLASGILANLDASINNAVLAAGPSSHNTALTSADLVAAAYTQTAALAAMSNPTPAQLDALALSLTQAYAVFSNEQGRMAAPESINRVLLMALYFARASTALAYGQRYPAAVQSRLQITALRLAQVRDLLLGGTGTPPPGDSAHAPSSVPPAVIGQVVTLSGANLAPVVAPLSLGTLVGDATQSPLAANSGTTGNLAAAALPEELAGASVTIGGRAAPLLYVSAARINFLVPAELPAGEAEVLVTSQSGYVSRGTVTVAPLAPALYTADNSGTGAALAINAAGAPVGYDFDVQTPYQLGSDKRTRLLLLATGFSAYAPLNTDTSNDVRLDGGNVQANLSESVAVEARTWDGRIFQLPVEYAGALGRMGGVDQVNVILRPELRGAGRVELTLVVAGQRSNTTTINVH